MNRTAWSVWLGTSLMLGACAGGSMSQQVRLCEQILTETGGALLIGSEGITDLCHCTVDSLAVRFPDAGEQWQAYAAELEGRFERRGVLGLVTDTVYLQTRGQEMAEFVEAQARIAGYCAQQFLESYQTPPGR